MKTARLIVVAIALAAVSNSRAGSAQSTPTQMPAMSHMDIQSHLVFWKAKPKETAMKLIEKYGPPQEATANSLIWHDKGPWKYDRRAV